MQKEAVIKIKSTGDLSFLHDDQLTAALQGDGDVSMVRASDVSWDNDKKLWYVLYPGTKTKMLDMGFVNRAAALAAEKDFLEKRMFYR